MIRSTISFYVMEFYKQFAAYTTQQLQEFGLSFGMMYFVIYVGKHPGCTPAEMTKNLHLDWGHCQRSVIKLVEDGFMTREKQGRSYHLGLTPAGERAFRTCHQVFFDWDAQNLSGLTEEEQPQHMGVESRDYVAWMVDYICRHREPVKLLLCCAEGTSYEHFVHNMV